MKVVDTIIHAGWIIPVEPEDITYENSALVIHEGKIADILLSDEAEKRYKANQVESLPNHLITPGLINCHTHAAMTLLRGYADDLPLQEWLEKHIWPAEGQWVSEDFVRDGTRLAIAEMILSGTTCFADMYFFPEIAALEAQEIGLKAQFSFPIMKFPTAWGSGPEDYLRKGLALHDKYRNHPNITIAFGPHAPYTVDDDTFKSLSVIAEELQAPIQVHLHETQHEVDESLAELGITPIQRLRKLGILSPLTQCVHMTALSDEDIGTIAETGATVVHCPESNLKLASGFTPVGKLMDANITVALGTDGAASNNDLNMLGEMRSAALIAKAVSQNAETLSAYQALKMATLEGARVLGIEETTGSLEKGKAADFIAIDLSDLSLQPIYQAISSLVYTCDRNHVTHLWCNGKPLMTNRQLTTINSPSLAKSIESWRKKLTESN